jgi:hypothetical protein
MVTFRLLALALCSAGQGIVFATKNFTLRAADLSTADFGWSMSNTTLSEKHLLAKTTG